MVNQVHCQEIKNIPKGWSIKFMPEIVKQNKNSIKIGPFGSQLKKNLLVKSGYKVYGQENIFENSIEIGNRYINTDHFNKLKTCEIVPGDFIISMMGTVGKCMIVPNNLEQGIMDSHLIRIKLNNSIINNEFLFHLFQSKIIFEQIVKLSVGGIMDGLSSTIIKNLQFNLPEIEEQEKIVRILFDIDELVKHLDNLIEKKKNIKQGAIQELLTGKRRLSGFDKDWDSDIIENCAKITTGSKNTQDKIENGAYPFFVRSKKIEQINSYSFDGEAVLTAGDGETGKIYHYIKGKFDFHQRVYAISDFDNRLDGYFFYIYFSNFFLTRIMSMTAKTSVDSVRREMISKMSIPLPEKEEQITIAQIISDMDSEIQELEEKRDKYTRIKNGMMQKLLTGEIRLV